MSYYDPPVHDSPEERRCTCWYDTLRDRTLRADCDLARHREQGDDPVEDYCDNCYLRLGGDYREDRTVTDKARRECRIRILCLPCWQRERHAALERDAADLRIDHEAAEVA